MKAGTDSQSTISSAHVQEGDNQRPKAKDQRQEGGNSLLNPTTEEFAVLSRFERLAFRLVRRMNQGGWKRFWTWCQKAFGAGWIDLSTDSLRHAFGLENGDAPSDGRPSWLGANRGSFFGVCALSPVLFRR